jgi:hypothetical protein
MTKILVLGLGAVLSVYGVYLCVKVMMWAYFKFQDSYDDLQTALRGSLQESTKFPITTLEFFIYLASRGKTDFRIIN